MNEHLIVIDAYNLAFRIFFSGSINVKAFFHQIRIIRSKIPVGEVILAGDSGKNWRHELYPEYKQNRASVPDEFIEQIKEIPIVARELGFQWINAQGWEADDIIFTIVANNPKKQITIVTSDKDLLQLLSYPNVSVWNQNKFITKSDVVKKFGVTPELLVDLLSLTGDASDNIPGVPKIGPKTAAILLNKYGSLSKLLSSLGDLPSASKSISLRVHSQ